MFFLTPPDAADKRPL